MNNLFVSCKASLSAINISYSSLDDLSHTFNVLTAEQAKFSTVLPKERHLRLIKIVEEATKDSFFLFLDLFFKRVKIGLSLFWIVIYLKLVDN